MFVLGAQKNHLIEMTLLGTHTIYMFYWDIRTIIVNWNLYLEACPHNKKPRYGFHLLRPQGYKTFFTLNSAENEIYPAHKC